MSEILLSVVAALAMTNAQFNFAVHGMVTVFCLSAAIYFAHRIFFDPYTTEGATRLAKGVFYGSAPWSVVWTFWTYVWYLRGVYGFGSPEVLTMLPYAPYVTLFEVAVCFGYTMHLYHVVYPVFGRFWRWAPTALVGSVFYILAKSIMPS